MVYNPKLEQIVNENLKNSGGKRTMKNRVNHMTTPTTKVKYKTVEECIKRGLGKGK